jgi:hypothetical protein
MNYPVRHCAYKRDTEARSDKLRKWKYCQRLLSAVKVTCDTPAMRRITGRDCTRGNWFHPLQCDCKYRLALFQLHVTNCEDVTGFVPRHGPSPIVSLAMIMSRPLCSASSAINKSPIFYFYISLYIFTSAYIVLHQTIYFYISLHIFTSTYICLHRPIYFYVSLYIFTSVYIFLHRPVYFYISLCIFTSAYIFTSSYIFLHHSIYFYISLYMFTSAYIFWHQYI